MNRFQEVTRIYNSALELEPAQREAYLREACGGNESLRKEIESLLNCWAEAQEFFKAPAVEAGAKALAREPPTDFTGRTVSHYAIVEKIGEGGMGVLYKARDTHLDRLVALKVLPPEKVADPERKRRFVQEAKAASALNHPNIVTIHDIDTADGVTFIAMEYVKGRTLDRLIRGKGIVLSETLRRSVQIADALAAAHAAGVIHRDIKPANIMVTDSGLVKVVDFGLAKLAEPVESGDGHTTEAGAILGTAAYMSPEQAEGKEVDARSDIFSFGSVLYEMTAGRPAFSGVTHASTLAAILRDEPEPVTQVAPDTPPELERVIGRCLRKDPERRFQNMADVKVALEELIEETQSGQPAVTARRRRRLAWAGGAFLLAAAAGIGTWFGLFRPAAGPVLKVSELSGLPGVQMTPALSPDGRQVAFVWNGEKQDNYDIYVKLVGDTTPRRLTSSPAMEYSPVWSPDALHIAFLRDTAGGTEVLRIPATGGAEERLHVSIAWCGTASYARQFCGLGWSPNGRFLTMVDKESPQAPNSIFLLDIETREKRKLTAPPSGFRDGLSVFSPDGRTLAFQRFPGLPLSDIYVLPLSASGQPQAEPRRITHDNVFIYGLDWTRDSRSIVFASSRVGVDALWRMARSGGTPERLAVGSADSFCPSISRTGNRLAFSYGFFVPHVWKVAAPGGGVSGPAAAPMRITHWLRLDQQPVFSPDGRRIAWVSMQSGSHQIWVAGSDGSPPAKLSDLAYPGADAPQWSPDGRQIAFRGFSPGPTHVYVVGADGGAPRRLTAGDFSEDPPSWSRDGRWVYFTSNRGERNAIWKVAAGGGSPILVARQGQSPVESFDSRFVYYADGLATTSGPAELLNWGQVYHAAPEASIWKVPTSGGRSPILLARKGGLPFFESSDGKFLYFSGPEASIWKVPTSGGEALPLLRTGRRVYWTLSAAGIYVLDPDADRGPEIEFVPLGNRRREVLKLPGSPESYVDPVGGMAASPDGRWIVYLHVDRREQQIMLAENFW